MPKSMMPSFKRVSELSPFIHALQATRDKISPPTPGGSNMRAFSLTALPVLTSISSAAPALGDKPRWEYAELTYRNLPGRPAGVDGDGNEIPAVPPSVSLKWISGAGEIEAKGWTDLAEKLKVTGLKKDGSLALQKIQ